jgi:multiple sugar transport system permease protein
MTTQAARPVSWAALKDRFSTDSKGGGGRKRRIAHPSLLPFAVPGFVIYAALVLVPLGLSIVYSFTNRNLLFPKAEFVGLANYVRLLSDSSFLSSFAFTVALTFGTLIGVNTFSLAVALLLDKMNRAYFAMRTVFFIPVALSGVIVAFIWSRILTDNGVLNSLLRDLGLEQLALSWLGSPVTAQGSVIFVTGWQAMGLAVVVYLAALQTVPKDLLDAARIDGAGWVLSFGNVTWPMIAPALTINTTLLLINGFKSFDIPTVLTGTGPGGATATVATEVIRVGFTLNRAGLASAMAVVLLLVVATVTSVIVGRLQKREVSS